MVARVEIPVDGTPEDQKAAEEAAKNAAAAQQMDNQSDVLNGQVKPMPEGGLDKFYDAKTGDYNWEGHHKDHLFRQNKSAEDKGGQEQQQAKPNDGNEKPADSRDDLQIKEASAEDNASDVETLVADIADEWAESGEITKESREAFVQKTGIPEQYLDQFAAGQAALGQLTVNAVYEAAGGEENYKAMVQWSQTGMNDAQRAAYNKTMTSGNMEEVLLAVEGLTLRFQNAEGQAPRMRVSGAPSQRSNEGGAFASWAQVAEAMKDPRYKNDPAYRKSVDTRVGNSNI